MQIKTIHIEFTNACNSKCIMCEYWKIANPKTINIELVFNSVTELINLGLKKIYFTGGECLLFADKLFELCRRIQVTFPELNLGLITNGVLIARYYREIAKFFSKVIISLDTLNPTIYRKIRGIDGLEQVKCGIHLLKESNFLTQVNLRTLILNENISELPNIVDYAINEHLNRISFLPEDTSSENTFGRSEGIFITSHRSEISLSHLKNIIETIKKDYTFEMGKLLSHCCKDLDYIYSLYAGKSSRFPKCNKSSASCVIGVDGLVSPCFFIKGSQYISDTKSLIDILNSKEYHQILYDINMHLYSMCNTCACPKELS